MPVDTSGRVVEGNQKMVAIKNTSAGLSWWRYRNFKYSKEVYYKLISNVDNKLRNILQKHREDIWKMRYDYLRLGTSNEEQEE